jgi:hypothetical protein
MNPLIHTSTQFGTKLSQKLTQQPKLQFFSRSLFSTRPPPLKSAHLQTPSYTQTQTLKRTPYTSPHTHSYNSNPLFVSKKTFFSKPQPSFKSLIKDSQAAFNLKSVNSNPQVHQDVQDAYMRKKVVGKLAQTGKGNLTPLEHEQASAMEHQELEKVVLNQMAQIKHRISNPHLLKQQNEKEIQEMNKQMYSNQNRVIDSDQDLIGQERNVKFPATFVFIGALIIFTSYTATIFFDFQQDFKQDFKQV